MKLTIILLATALFSLATTAMAAQTETTALPWNPVTEAATSAVALPECDEADLPFLSDAPARRQSGACGPCSQSLCQGLSVGQYCQVIGIRLFTCQVLNGAVCGGSFTWKCSCV